MDGVLSDFFGNALDVHGSNGVGYPKGEYQIEKYLGISTNDFWRGIDAAGEEFWRQMDVCDGALGLLNVIDEKSHKPIVLTSPSMQPSCVSGKLKWLHRVFGMKFRDYIFCPAQHKHLLATPTSLLIDDRESNCDEFNAAGGQSILWPHLGNTASYSLSDAHEMVSRALD